MTTAHRKTLKWFYCKACGNSYQATQARAYCTPQCREATEAGPNAQLALDMLRNAVDNITFTKLDPTAHAGRLAQAIRALTDKLHDIHSAPHALPETKAFTQPAPPTPRRPCGCKDKR